MAKRQPLHTQIKLGASKVICPVWSIQLQGFDTMKVPECHRVCQVDTCTASLVPEASNIHRAVLPLSTDIVSVCNGGRVSLRRCCIAALCNPKPKVFVVVFPGPSELLPIAFFVLLSECPAFAENLNLRANTGGQDLAHYFYDRPHLTDHTCFPKPSFFSSQVPRPTLRVLHLCVRRAPHKIPLHPSRHPDIENHKHCPLYSNSSHHHVSSRSMKLLSMLLTATQEFEPRSPLGYSRGSEPIPRGRVPPSASLEARR
jgi:hypothetical protein